MIQNVCCCVWFFMKSITYIHIYSNIGLFIFSRASSICLLKLNIYNYGIAGIAKRSGPCSDEWKQIEALTKHDQRYVSISRQCNMTLRIGLSKQHNIIRVGWNFFHSNIRHCHSLPSCVCLCTSQLWSGSECSCWRNRYPQLPVVHRKWSRGK